MANLTSVFLGTMKPEYLDLGYNLTRYFSVLHINFLIYFSLIGIIYTYYYFYENKKSDFHKLKLEKELSDSKMISLKSRLHPHFLFNALNSIHSLMQTDIKKSQDMVVDLGDLLRKMIDIGDENLIPLDEELRILDKYLSIQRIRFADDLQVLISLGDDIEDALVPSMIIQPILENAIKHGYSPTKKELVISLEIFEKEGFINYLIKNNGKALEYSLNHLIKKGTGIKNILGRLEATFDKNYYFNLSNSENSVVAIVRFPFFKKEYELYESSNLNNNKTLS